MAISIIIVIVLDKVFIVPNVPVKWNGGKNGHRSIGPASYLEPESNKNKNPLEKIGSPPRFLNEGPSYSIIYSWKGRRQMDTLSFQRARTNGSINCLLTLVAAFEQVKQDLFRQLTVPWATDKGQWWRCLFCCSSVPWNRSSSLFRPTKKICIKNAHLLLLLLLKLFDTCRKRFEARKKSSCEHSLRQSHRCRGAAARAATAKEWLSICPCPLVYWLFNVEEIARALHKNVMVGRVLFSQRVYIGAAVLFYGTNNEERLLLRKLWRK